MDNMKKLKNKKRGFTLIETLFAILIFSSSLAALLVVSGGGINNTIFAKNQLTAFFLAQEGVEMVRNIRDSVWLDGKSWSNDFLRSTNGVFDCVTADGCMIDYDLKVSPCGASCDPLKYDSVTGIFNYTASVNSIFTRTIIIVNYASTPPSPLAKVISKVSWAQGSNAHNIVFKENLFDWY